MGGAMGLRLLLFPNQGMSCSALSSAAPLAAMVFLASPALVHAECLVHGESASLEKLVVRPASSPAFSVDVVRLPIIAAIPPSASAPTRVEVGGALAFRGVRRNIWYTLATPLVAAHGMLHLAVGAQLVDTRVRGNTVIASAVLVGGDVLEGEDRPPLEVAAPVSVPCAALTLDASVQGAPLADVEGDGTFWQFRSRVGRLVFHAEPRSSAAKLVFTRHGVQSLSLFELERITDQGEWRRVVRRGDDGGTNVIATGWVLRSELEPLIERSGERSGVPGSTHGTYGSRYAGALDRVYEGPARVAPRTTLHARRNGAAWATVQEAVILRVRYRAGETWAQVTTIPGVGGPEISSNAFVSVAALELPPGTEP